MECHHTSLYKTNQFVGNGYDRNFVSTNNFYTNGDVRTYQLPSWNYWSNNFQTTIQQQRLPLSSRGNFQQDLGASFNANLRCSSVRPNLRFSSNTSGISELSHSKCSQSPASNFYSHFSQSQPRMLGHLNRGSIATDCNIEQHSLNYHNSQNMVNSPEVYMNCSIPTPTPSPSPNRTVGLNFSNAIFSHHTINSRQDYGYAESDFDASNTLTNDQSSHVAGAGSFAQPFAVPSRNNLVNYGCGFPIQNHFEDVTPPLASFGNAVIDTNQSSTRKSITPHLNATFSIQNHPASPFNSTFGNAVNHVHQPPVTQEQSCFNATFVEQNHLGNVARSTVVFRNGIDVNTSYQPRMTKEMPRTPATVATESYSTDKTTFTFPFGHAVNTSYQPRMTKEMSRTPATVTTESYSTDKTTSISPFGNAVNTFYQARTVNPPSYTIPTPANQNDLENRTTFKTRFNNTHQLTVNERFPGSINNSTWSPFNNNAIQPLITKQPQSRNRLQKEVQHLEQKAKTSKRTDKTQRKQKSGKKSQKQPNQNTTKTKQRKRTTGKERQKKSNQNKASFDHNKPQRPVDSIKSATYQANDIILSTSTVTKKSTGTDKKLDSEIVPPENGERTIGTPSIEVEAPVGSRPLLKCLLEECNKLESSSFHSKTTCPAAPSQQRSLCEEKLENKENFTLGIKKQDSEDQRTSKTEGCRDSNIQANPKATENNDLIKPVKWECLKSTQQASSDFSSAKTCFERKKVLQEPEIVEKKFTGIKFESVGDIAMKETKVDSIKREKISLGLVVENIFIPEIKETLLSDFKLAIEKPSSLGNMERDENLTSSVKKANFPDINTSAFPSGSLYTVFKKRARMTARKSKSPRIDLVYKANLQRLRQQI